MSGEFRGCQINHKNDITFFYTAGSDVVTGLIVLWMFVA